MNQNGLIASIVSSATWPIVTLVLIYLLRDYLGGLIERLEEVTIPAVGKARFVKLLEEGRTERELVATKAILDVQQTFSANSRRLQLAEHFPEASIIEAYKEVEGALLELRDRLSLAPRTNLISVVRALSERGLVGWGVQELFRSFQKARNASAHAGIGAEITSGQALEYMSQAGFLQAIFEDALNKLPVAIGA
jgi:hypothetical protein